jgi:hypothetical protein
MGKVHAGSLRAGGIAKYNGEKTASWPQVRIRTPQLARGTAEREGDEIWHERMVVHVRPMGSKPRELHVLGAVVVINKAHAPSI